MGEHDILLKYLLKVQSCKLYNDKYMIGSTQITNTEIVAFISVLVFRLLSRKVLFINRKGNRNLKSRLLFMKIANFTSKLLQNCKKLEWETFRTLETSKRSFISAFFSFHDCTFTFNHLICLLKRSDHLNFFFSPGPPSNTSC